MRTPRAWTIVAGLLLLLVSSHQTVSMTMEHSHFLPLPCNSDFSMPCQPLDISHVGTSDIDNVYVVPCGTCQVLDGNDFVDAGAIANFVGGLNVEGHLKILPPTDAASTLWIKSPFVFVQGKLTVDTESFLDRFGAIHIELLASQGDGDDDADIMMLPHVNNSMACASYENGACNVGKRPFVVAGGEVDIRGYKQSCPSWTNLVNVAMGGMAQLDPSQYEQVLAPTTPSAECSSIVISQSFDNDSSYLNSWDGNGASEYGIVTEGEDSYYKVSGRGPRVTLANPECLTPGAPYLFSMKIKLSTSTGVPSTCSQSGGWPCPRLILYRKSGSGSEKSRRLGRLYSLQDDVWRTFNFEATFGADEVGPSSNNQVVALFITGPEESVDIAVDDFVLELAPPGTYPDPSQVCAELLPNGDAEHGSGANIFPFTFAGGEASVVTENGNSFFRQSGRSASWMRLNTKLVTGCVVEDVVYRISAKVWVHSSVPRQAEIVAGSKQPDGSMNWSTMLLCPYSDESSGFVSCESTLSFSSKQIAATEITLYIRPRGDATSTIDWDDLSLQFVDGPVQGLLVDPSLYDCWADQISEGAEVLVTSHTLDPDDNQLLSASGMTAEGKISLATPFTNPMSGPGDFTVEVALLSRRIVLEASSDSSIGGHFIVLHTPDVNQTIRGVQIKGFGQQGILGRYPIHFHMCDNVDGSVVSHNVILNSNQRCLVAHGTNALLIEDNVAYNTSGHCFVLEDGGEVDNMFRNNLGALTKKVSTLISNDETDDEPSTYWITNPQNSFENNVAAGSEGRGFWFELRTRVRGPSAGLHPGVNPSKLPLKSFVGNVAHSNSGGLATYPGAGYNPDEEAVFEDMKSYRNRWSGIFLHNSGHLAIQGGTFADNRIGIDVDRAHSLRIIGSHIVGVTPSFAESVSSSGKTGHCPSMNPVIGVQLHSSQKGGTTAYGAILQDVSFEHLGEGTQCTGSSALGVDPNENFELFDPRTSVEGLLYDAYTSKINLCPAVDSGINVAIHDKDGSLGGSPGFIVSNNAEMTTFSSCTAESDASCASVCANTCLRTLSLSVSSLTPADLQLVVAKEGTGGEPSISLSGYFDYRDWDPYWNTRSQFTRRFFVTLPASGSYQAQFILDNTLTWPVFVERSWEDVDGCGPAFSLDIDENGSRNCDQLIVNGDAEGNSTEGWWHTAGGIETLEGGADGSSFSFSSQYRHYSSWGIAQFLDTRCMVEGRKYMLQASVKLIDQDGSPFTCTPGNNQIAPCPAADLRSRFGTTNPVASSRTIATMDSWTTGDWNKMNATFTVTEEEASAGSVLLSWHRAPAGVKVILDEITLSCVSGCESFM